VEKLGGTCPGGREVKEGGVTIGRRRAVSRSHSEDSWCALMTACKLKEHSGGRRTGKAESRGRQSGNQNTPKHKKQRDKEEGNGTESGVGRQKGEN